jgi:hypothetical protein
MAYTIQLARAEDGERVIKAISQMMTAAGISGNIRRMRGLDITIQKVRWAIDGTNLLQEEWAKFNTWMNDTLDKEVVIADVWSTPFDVKGRLWIRRGERRVA